MATRQRWDGKTIQIISVSIAPTIAAIGVVIVGILNLNKSTDNGKKSDLIINKATEIHTLTNSNLSKITNDLALANEKIAGLDKLLAALVAEKANEDKLKPESEPIKVQVANPPNNPANVKDVKTK